MLPFDVQIDLETPVHPTESIEKVKAAIANIFPDAVFEGPKDDILRATARELDKLKEKLALQAIRDASRRILTRGIRPGHIYVSMAKQAAYAGRVSFSDDGPLGDITVIIRTNKPDMLIESITDTKDNDHERRRPHEKFSKDDYSGNLEE